MKRFALLIVSAILLLCGCDKMDNKITFENFTGKDFYDCQVWFRDTEGGDLIGYEEAGNVLMGESGKVKKLGNYCYIYAKDARGKMVMTKDKSAYDGMSFSKNDLY